ncbi:CopG domain protein DNA-binding domain protein (plasmid) [Leptolyngbya sp. NIES-3755]|nr:CopG domain protein DNA-binding domain protein [Leptolyngbya sp. NIES-3755]
MDTYRKRVYVIMNQPAHHDPMPRVKGVPADRDEIKERHNVMVSPSAWEGLDTIAKELGYKSRSDLIEAVGRREVKLEKLDER